jgi:hypothetical protein
MQKNRTCRRKGINVACDWVHSKAAKTRKAAVVDEGSYNDEGLSVAIVEQSGVLKMGMWAWSRVLGLLAFSLGVGGRGPPLRGSTL